MTVIIVTANNTQAKYRDEGSDVFKAYAIQESVPPSIRSKLKGVIKPFNNLIVQCTDCFCVNLFNPNLYNLIFAYYYVNPFFKFV